MGVQPGFSELTALSLKQLFQHMCNTKKPTCYANMPPNIRLAKQINSEIHTMIAAGKLEASKELPDNILDQTVSELLQEGPEAGSSLALTGLEQSSETLSCVADSLTCAVLDQATAQAG